MNDKDFKKIFKAHKFDVSDDGFSKRIVREFPERKSMLPQIVMATFVTIGFVFTFSIQGISPLLEQIISLVTSISQFQIPSPSSIVAYTVVLALTGMIGFAMVQADAG